MKKLFYSIGEVAEVVGESVQTVRSWSDSFPKLFKVKRDGRNQRQFMEDDLENFIKLRYLVRMRGFSCDGAVKQILEDKDGVERRLKVLENLKEIRNMLTEIKDTL